MKRFNLFYITVILLGIGLFSYLGLENQSSPISFYGFAESDETEINYNYPVVVDKILVSPGQEVQKGDTLLQLSRRKSKESLDDYQFKINRLQAEAAQKKDELEDDILILEQQKSTSLSEIQIKIEALENELSYKKSLTEGLQNVETGKSIYSPIGEEIEELKTEYDQTQTLYDLRIKAKETERESIAKPYNSQISRIRAEESFDENQKIISIAVLAPGNGLIGNISCKEDEHIPSYKTLLTFYEPHSRYVRGYVHEDLTLEVKEGHAFKVSSLKNPEINYDGKVVGMGSRIIEIPARLRTIPAVKSYGREVIVAISRDNSFLQKEKVSLTYISNAYSE